MEKFGIGLQEQTNRDTFKDFTCISLTANHIRELPNGLKCPTLQTLLLQKRYRFGWPSCFFLEMNISKFQFWDRPTSQHYLIPFSILINLRTLDINCCKFGDLSLMESYVKLRASTFPNLLLKPISFGQLSNLKILNNCSDLTLIPPDVIQLLEKLQELYISRFWKWEWRSNVRLAESQALFRFTILQIYIPSLCLSPKFFVISKLVQVYIKNRPC